MSEYLDSNNNLVDIDSLDNVTFSNITYTNGFGQLENKTNRYYIKKCIKNYSKKSKDLSNNKIKNNITPQKVLRKPYLLQKKYNIKTIPTFNFEINKSKDRIKENIKSNMRKIDAKHKIYIYRKKGNTLLDNRKKIIKENNLNSTIDEINISLKKLKTKTFKLKNNSQQNKKNRFSRNINNINKLNQTYYHKRNNTELITKNSMKTNYKTYNTTMNKNNFNNFMIKREHNFSYINNGKNNKIIFLQKIIYQQKNKIKLLKEQNKNLIEKMKKMNNENKNILKDKKIKVYSPNNDINRSIESNLNTISYIKDNYYNSPIDNILTNILKKEVKNNLDKQMIYCLYDKENLLCYNSINKEFKLKPIKNKEFKNLYNKEINTLYLFDNINNKLYIIAGLNNDQFFIYDLNKNKIQKYSKLKNNHMFGSLLLSKKKNNIKPQLICLSGKYNKKVEIYNELDDSWNDKSFEEMPEERSNAYYLLLNNNYIYGFYGYNYILNKYLNDIVCYDFNNNKWKKIMNNSLNNNKKGIKCHFCYENAKDKLIYILGGDSNSNKILIDIKKEIIVEIEENSDDKNEKIIINNSFGYNIEKDILTLFDINFNVHKINYFTNEEEIIKYDEKNIKNL